MHDVAASHRIPARDLADSRQRTNASFAAGLIVLLLALSSAGLATAQVNIEQHRPQDEGTSLAIDASGSLRSGNSDLYDVSTAGQLRHRSGSRTVLVLARVRYGKNDGTTYASSSFGHFRYTQSLRPRIAAEAFTQLERDRFTLLQVRSLIGAGGRFEIAGTERLQFHAGSSLMLELEKLDASKVSVHPASSESFRWSNYLSFRWAIAQGSSLSSTVYAQPRIDALADVRLLHDAALEVAITSVVSLRLVLRQRFDNRPPDNIEKHDVFFENGIRVRF